MQRAEVIQPLALCADGEETTESLSSHATAKSLVLCCSDPYGSRWARGHEWVSGGPSGWQVMDLGFDETSESPTAENDG